MSFVQHDTKASKISFTFYDDVNVIMTNIEEATATVKRPDGKTYTFGTDCFEIVDNVVTFVLPPAALYNAGECEASVSVYDSDHGRITTQTFTYEVTEELISDTPIDETNQYPIVTDLVSKVAANDIKINNVATQANATDSRINNIVANAGSGNTEIVDARTSLHGTIYTVLKNRLDNIESNIDNIFYTVPPSNNVDDTQMLQEFFANGYKNVLFNGTYKINLADGDSIAYYIGQSNIRIYGHDAKIIDTKTNYTRDGAITPIFKFDNCKNIDINIDFEGVRLANVSTDLGYTGATFVYAVNKCEEIKVRGTFKNLRYAVLSGNYSVPNLGNCSGFDIDIITDYCGYSAALYLADIKKINIYATNTHRACYLAGVNGMGKAEVNVKFKDQYIAPIQVIVTDALLSAGVSRGCSNLRIKAQDLGSTVYPSTGSFCAGISLSRVDPGTIFENLEFDVFVKSSNLISSKVGGFYIASNAKDYNSYPYNWENTIVLRNIKVTGIIDKSAQTVANGTNGDLYISTTDAGHSASISNFNLEDLIILSCSAPAKIISIDLSGLSGTTQFKNIIIKNVALGLTGNLTSNVNIVGSDLLSLTVYGKYSLLDSKVGSISDTGNNGSFINTFVNNSKISIRLNKAEIDLVGNSLIVFSNAIPKNAMVLDVQCLVTKAAVGNTSFDVGITGATNLFAWGMSGVLGTKTNMTAGNGNTGTPKIYPSATSIRVSGTNTFTDGKLLVMVWYIELTPPSL
jgi:hypothetical protein